MNQDRRNEFDVTNTVQVSSPAAVRDAVHELFSETFPGTSFDKLWLAFYDFERLFSGRYPGYNGCDTTYHDMQHTLDMTLALARLVSGYERSVEPSDRLGAARAQMSIITSLFHDSGYIRHESRDSDFANGAEFTLYHVSRSADFLRRYLPELGLAKDVAVASIIVHFTGYEVDLDNIELEDPRDIICGHLIGTADLIAQMADRCYLEKCRDHLYNEFVIGGIAVENSEPGEYTIRYESGEDLLKKTPTFYQQVMRERLNSKFNRVYRYIEVLYDGQNPYIDAIRVNMTHLVRIIESGDWSLLRRKPSCFLGLAHTVQEIEKAVRRQLKAIRGATTRQDGSLLMPV
ncbi:MAG: hypothetical protein KJP08_00990 [Gammaproteobacteria bacterium]|nr:hypothetical protein [Gammaproteobacteria bacterium]NNF50559.1 hypothetical protein [Woeseiaceae bacterium]MBT8093358.1 hypothetical protein [Gammaproteobacteria bacterium]MBT8104387.1 hypothetical protein [Gammaproteobacteria bacterium]NNK24403.1 hypothetical protein [Woeseiaceae bacterium]